MVRNRTLATVIAVGAIATSLLCTSPALAKISPPPSEEPPAAFCPEGTVPPVTQPDGSVIFGVEAGGAGCVVVRTIPQGIGLVEVITAPGWTWTFSGGGGGSHNGGGVVSGKVDVKFEQIETGRDIEVRVEPGRTEVK